MEFLKSLFTKPLSYDEFVAAATGAGIKLVDLSGGEYVAKGKLTEVTDKNKALTDKIASYERTIGELKTSAGNADTLKSRIAELEKSIADRDAAEKAATEAAAIAGRFDAVSADKPFLNDFTKDGMLREFREALGKPEYKGKGDAEIFAALTKDRDGIFANPNPPAIPGMGSVPPAAEIDENAARAAMGLPPLTK